MNSYLKISKNISKNINVKNIVIIALGIIVILNLLRPNLLRPNLLGIERFTDYDEANLGNIRVGKSEKAGRGVFANKDLKRGDIIEVCPLVEDKRKNIRGRLVDYLFDSKTKGNSLLPFGYCAIVNHSSKPNAIWRIDNDKMIMLCLKDIKKGDEIFHSYGAGYWNTRKELKKV